MPPYYTYAKTLQVDKRNSHYCIYFEGRVCPFGASFYSIEGDSLRHVKKAVSVLNKAFNTGIKRVTLDKPDRFSSQYETWFRDCTVTVNVGTTDLQTEHN